MFCGIAGVDKEKIPEKKADEFELKRILGCSQILPHEIESSLFARVFGRADYRFSLSELEFMELTVIFSLCPTCTGGLRTYSNTAALLVGSVGKVTQVIGAVVDVQFSVSVALFGAFVPPYLRLKALSWNLTFHECPLLFLGETSQDS